MNDNFWCECCKMTFTSVRQRCHGMNERKVQDPEEQSRETARYHGCGTEFNSDPGELILEIRLFPMTTRWTLRLRWSIMIFVYQNRSLKMVLWERLVRDFRAAKLFRYISRESQNL